MSTVSSPLLCSSDKSFWHGYIDFYEPYLPQNILGNIVEFGVFNGHSIQWLMERYPHANIVGVDILPTQAEWPQAPQVRYVQLDQGSEKQIASFFAGIPAPALIIEDGSHIPEHQSRCLKHGLKKLTPGGTYILEDIHTSHPEHILFKREFGSRSIMERIGLKPIKPAQTSLSILLAVEHIRPKPNWKKWEPGLISRPQTFCSYSRKSNPFMCTSEQHYPPHASTAAAPCLSSTR
jgi:hypothetical protein